ncbi:PaaI family thioesterase [Henriciella marina]|uniref:PaaI family thioesterase n=1 Tax=Henriciella marina TaxID=453851 RepID=UPI000372B36E|nr:PaaI family thioesterase [Henriciella marina]
MTDRAAQLQAFLDRTPFARFIGMEFKTDGGTLVTKLPFQEKFIGNRAINALHGGATGAFLELTAMAQVYLESELQRPPKPINITIDYLRSAKSEDLYARAIVHKLGRRMASVRAEAWQGEDPAKIVTALQAHFLVAENS